MDADPDTASVTFLGVERIDVLRFGPDRRNGLDGVFHHVTLGCSRYPMTDPSAPVSDPLLGPRAEVVLSLRSALPSAGLARTLAVVAATPAVEGVVLNPGALVDLSGPLWSAAPFTAVLLGVSDIPEYALPAFLLLGRVTGTPEEELQDQWRKGDRETAVRKALEPAPRGKR